MANTKYGKCIITELHEPKKKLPWTPEFTPEELVHVLCLNDDILKGSFYVVTDWTLPPFANKVTGKPHKHDFDEVLAFFGSDYSNPHELNAEAVIPLDDEKHVVTKSCIVFIPKGVMHGPIVFNRIDKPVFMFSCGPTKKYG